MQGYSKGQILTHNVVATWYDPQANEPQYKWKFSFH